MDSMKYFIPRHVLRMFPFPCSNFILNVALQLTLSSCKVSSNSVFSSCVHGSNLTLTDVNRLSKADYSCKSNKKKLEAPWRILFFGTDEFAVKSLQLLCSKYRTNTLISKLEVVSSEKGKHSPVIQFAKDENLVLYHWPLNTDHIQDQYDIGMVVSFGHLIPSKIINSFPLGMVNVHGSILPRWRGAAPIVHAILHGDHETGISIIRVRPKHYDRGEIVRQYRCSISPHDTAGELHDRLAQVGGELLLDCVRDMPRCVLNAPKQPDEGASYAKKIDASYSLIDWGSMTALQVYNLHRALGHIYPLLTQWNGVKVKLHNISLDTVLRPTSTHESRGSKTPSASESPKASSNYIDNKEFSGDPIPLTANKKEHLQSNPVCMNNAASDVVGKTNNFSIQSENTQTSQKPARNPVQISSALSFLAGTPKSNSSSIPRPSDCQPGTVSFDRSRKLVRVTCVDGKSIVCAAITVSGKKRMSAVDFNNGFIGKVKEEDRRFVNLDKTLYSIEKE